MSKVSRSEFKEFLKGKKLFVENKLKEVKDVLNIINNGEVLIGGEESFWISFEDGSPIYVTAEVFYKDLAKADELSLEEFLLIEESDFCDFKVGDVLLSENGDAFIFGGCNGDFLKSIAGFNSEGVLILTPSDKWVYTARKANAAQKAHLYATLRSEGYVYDEQRNCLIEIKPRVLPGRPFYFIAPDFSKKEYRVFYGNEDGKKDGLPYLFHKQQNYFYSKQEALGAIEKIKF